MNYNNDFCERKGSNLRGKPEAARWRETKPNELEDRLGTEDTSDGPIGATFTAPKSGRARIKMTEKTAKFRTSRGKRHHFGKPTKIAKTRRKWANKGTENPKNVCYRSPNWPILRLFKKLSWRRACINFASKTSEIFGKKIEKIWEKIVEISRGLEISHLGAEY